MNYTLGITILHARDMQTAKRFYTEALDLPLVEELSSPQFVTLRLNGETLLGLEDVAGAKFGQTAQPGTVEIGWKVDDGDATYNQWQAKGIPKLTEPQDFPFGRAFDAQDPEGHLLSVYRLGAN